MSHVDDLRHEIAMLREIISHQHGAGDFNNAARNIERLAKIVRTNKAITGGGREIDEMLGTLLEEVGAQMGIPE